eukprot:UN34039
MIIVRKDINFLHYQEHKIITIPIQCHPYLIPIPGLQEGQKINQKSNNHRTKNMMKIINQSKKKEESEEPEQDDIENLDLIGGPGVIVNVDDAVEEQPKKQ